MAEENIDTIIRQGIEAAEKGYIHSAQVLLNQAVEGRNTPELHSYLAYCMAKDEGRISAAARTCRESIRREPGNSLHYLLLGRILLLAGEKTKAVAAFRQGLKTSPNPKIIVELKSLGLRKPAIFKSLDRKHPLNKVVGKVFSTIGLR
ncbi:hypothetical protein SAMN02745165_02101 [Malonomonas rubra DSM 5091]|uniref:Uncharacterized protein n=1 Tax=Malonomonas rubra DSM 5091 TaxID=1122189 RepID=A0A1M6IBN3_MALRU|nr:hypothetical protein [Malonomonas rubra]SHJ31825.1 hypothetical protein SAMN02745165_02101 [Malonomonas rubra DSM 5091]